MIGDTIAPVAAHDRLAPLRDLVAGLTGLVDRTGDEPELLAAGARLLTEAITRDDWLPRSHAVPGAERYRQYLLHRDPAARFSVVSFVWGPGQSTPIHDHTVWGLVGVLRGAEIAERFLPGESGLRSAGEMRLERGDVDLLSPAEGDVHRVRNAYDDAVSISIHVYGGDIGAVRRSTFDAEGRAAPFVSAYSDAPPLQL